MTLIARLAAALDSPPGPLRGDWDFETGGDRAETLTPAAVLFPVIDRPEPTVLLTRRTETMRRHAGQIAFPGGRADPEDTDAVATALREAEEEVALAPSQVRVIGVSDTYETGTGYSITPVVGVVAPDLPLVPHEIEVAALFEVPLAHLLEAANHQVREGDFRGKRRRYFAIQYGEHEIWGATAGIIVNLARRVAA